MPVVVVISQHLLNVFVQLANKRRLKKFVILDYIDDSRTLINASHIVSCKLAARKQMFQIPWMELHEHELSKR
jgi:hypothetical protein